MSKKTTRCNKKNKGGTKRKRTNSRSRSPSSRSPSRSPSRSRLRLNLLPPSPPSPSSIGDEWRTLPVWHPTPGAYGRFSPVLSPRQGPNTLANEFETAIRLKYPEYAYHDDRQGEVQLPREPRLPPVNDDDIMTPLIMRRSYAHRPYNKYTLTLKIDSVISDLEDKLSRASSMRVIERIEDELITKRRMLDYIDGLTDDEISQLNLIEI